jgi:hypothetical protein
VADRLSRGPGRRALALAAAGALLLGCVGDEGDRLAAFAPGDTFVLECHDGPPITCFQRTSGPAATTPTSTTLAAITTLAAVATTTVATTTVLPAQRSWLDDHFLIGVDLQPASLFDEWRARGINTAVRVDAATGTGNPGSTDAQIAAWETAATANGLRTIRQPKSNPVLDIGNTTLLAWSPHKDEPDGNFAPTPDKQVQYETIQARYAELRAIDPTRPITVVVTGSFNQNDARYWPNNDPADGAQACCEPWYRKFFAGADWLFADRYPVNLGKPIVPELRAMMERLHTWQEPERAKPVFAYIEASDYSTAADRPAPGPTAEQLRAQVWYVITKGARGIVYFPERVAPTFAHDATTAAVQAEMTTLHSRIREIEAALQGPINPSDVGVAAPVPLEVGWRVTATHVYLIVVNASGTALPAQRLGVLGVGGTAEVMWENRNETIRGGMITDDFAPFATHVYRLAR